MSESITEELREYAAEHSYWRRGTEYVTLNDLLPIADRIDARFDRELQAKHDEIDGLKADVDGLQARLDASMPLPLDADGVPCRIGDTVWTEDGKSWFVDGLLRIDDDLVIYALPGDGSAVPMNTVIHVLPWMCHHVAPEPPETIEDVRKSCDNTIAYLASVSGMGWHDVETFSNDVHKQLDHAYACGKRDGAGEQR